MSIDRVSLQAAQTQTKVTPQEDATRKAPEPSKKTVTPQEDVTKKAPAPSSGGTKKVQIPTSEKAKEKTNIGLADTQAPEKPKEKTNIDLETTQIKKAPEKPKEQTKVTPSSSTDSKKPEPAKGKVLEKAPETAEGKKVETKLKKAYAILTKKMKGGKFREENVDAALYIIEEIIDIFIANDKQVVTINKSEILRPEFYDKFIKKEPKTYEKAISKFEDLESKVENVVSRVSKSYLKASGVTKKLAKISKTLKNAIQHLEKRIDIITSNKDHKYKEPYTKQEAKYSADYFVEIVDSLDLIGLAKGFSSFTSLKWKYGPDVSKLLVAIESDKYFNLNKSAELKPMWNSLVKKMKSIKINPTMQHLPSNFIKEPKKTKTETNKWRQDTEFFKATLYKGFPEFDLNSGKQLIPLSLFKETYHNVRFWEKQIYVLNPNGRKFETPIIDLRSHYILELNNEKEKVENLFFKVLTPKTGKTSFKPFKAIRETDIPLYNKQGDLILKKTSRPTTKKASAIRVALIYRIARIYSK